MAFSKDRLRKIHGVPEPKGPDDPTVVARRKTHEAAAKWCNKWLTPLHAVFALIGFSVVLLPVLLKPWRFVIENTPLLAKIFHDYSTISELATTHLYASMAVFLIRGWQLKSLPGARVFPSTYKNVLDMELFPRTKREEFAFWIDISFGLVGTTLWLFLPFGVLAYFIKIGG